MLFALAPEAPMELVVGRINVDRREFWSLASDARPQRILSERITEKLAFTKLGPNTWRVREPNDLVRCALPDRGDRLLLADAANWVRSSDNNDTVEIGLSEWSLGGKRLRQWRFQAPNADAVYAGYIGDAPTLLLIRGDLDHVSAARWGERKDHLLPRAALPASLRLLPKNATGWEPDWPLADAHWMPLIHEDDTYSRPFAEGATAARRLRLLWRGAESPWRAEGNEIVGPTTVSLPVKGAFLAQLVQTGPNRLVAVLQTQELENLGLDVRSGTAFEEPREVWMLDVGGATPVWRSRLIDGEWVAVRREGDAWPLRWPELFEPERFPIGRDGNAGGPDR